MANSAQYGNLHFTPAIRFFRKKLNMPSQRWADVWRSQHNTAFMVAGAMKEDLIADLRAMVDSAIAEGRSLSWFKKQFKQAVKKHGWDHTGSAAWRSNIIYGTNMRQAYNAGRWEQLQQFEYWRYAHGDSRYPRLHHLAHDGKVLPKSSPFWRVWFPQNGWGCKCKVYGETKRSLQRRGLSISDEPVIDTREWTDKATGEVHKVPVGIDPGFDYSPGQVSQKQQIQQQRATMPPLAQRLPERKIPSTYSTVSGVDIQGMNKLTERLLSTPSAPQVEQMSRFVKHQQIKTLVLNHSEVHKGPAANRLADDIANYLTLPKAGVSYYYTVPDNKVPEGFSRPQWQHVVVTSRKSVRLSHADPKQMHQGAARIITDAMQNSGPYNGKWWATVQATDNLEDAASRYITWLHEIGHKLHNATGRPAPPVATALTRQAELAANEWVAEHFVLWVLAGDKLTELTPEIAAWYQALIQQVTNETP